MRRSGRTGSENQLLIQTKGEEVIEDLDEAEEVIESPYSITSYGADYPVDSLVRRINSKDIVVPDLTGMRQSKPKSSGFSANTFGLSRRRTGSSNRCCWGCQCREFF